MHFNSPNRLFLVLLFTNITLFSFAQNAITQDSVTARLNDTAQFNFYKKEKIFGKQTLVPIAFIGYGAAALGVQGLKNFNENIQKKIWTNNPHSVTHIDNYLQFAPGASVYILNLSGIKGKHNLKDATFIYALSNLFVTGSVQVTKRLTHEWRPDASDRYSFPSGHTATAFAGAEFLRLEYKDVSVWYGVCGYAAAAFTGYLRMYNNKHWFGDVLAGAGVGVLSTDLAYYLYPSLQNIFSGKKKNYSAVIFPTYRQGAVGLSFAYKW